MSSADPRSSSDSGADATAAGDAAGRALGALTRETARLRYEAETARANSLRSANALLEVEQRLATTNARLAACEPLATERAQEIAMLAQRIDRAERVMAAMQRSLSWRLTAPLRSLKSHR
ncbi:MAG TPA: hypothetical protein VMB05_03270 [Solirubrobacteraceae bacterium]|nr:hypothetical protein [Solirubrobacteraceae bacterium]